MAEWKKADKAFPGLFSEKGDAAGSPATEGAAASGPGGTPAEGEVTSHAPMCNKSLYSLILSFVPVIGSIPAVIFGHMALGEIQNSDTHMDGRKLALTGLGLGYSVLLAGVLYGLFTLSAMAFAPSQEGEWDLELMNPPAAEK